MGRWRWAAMWRLVAVVALLSWVALAVARDYPPLRYALGIIVLLLLFACWIGAVWVWFRSPSRDVYHRAAFPLLILLGFLWGWAYILAAAGAVDQREQENQRSGAD